MELPVDLMQLSHEADQVFQGVCQSKRYENFVTPDTGETIPVVIYTFKTKDWIKGDPKETVEVKQLSAKSRGEAMRLGFLGLYDPITLDVGKDYLLFLTAPSKWGFQFTVGSNQGRFKVEKDGQGKSVVINGSGNRGLFEGISQSKSLGKSEQAVVEAPPGPVSYDDFTSLVKKALQ
ncbi:MAG: hypothetical protein Q7T03_07730 [Deltaproteobacteria bacterium]|nr:hypothetical protein [Deltaproteobacteria bacterium]